MIITGEEILIQGIFGGWRNISVEKVRTMASLIKTRGTGIPEDEKLDYINSRIIGIKFESLDEIPEYRPFRKEAEE